MRVIPFLTCCMPALLAAASACAAEAVRPTSQPGPVTAAALQGGPIPELAVTVDRAKVVRLPENTKVVVVGNPAIADVTIQKSGVMVMTGKSYGLTNLIALDATGNVLAESTLSVQAATDSVMVVQRGLERQSYSCTPACLPSILLGDGKTYFSDNRDQAEQRAAMATPK